MTLFRYMDIAFFPLEGEKEVDYQYKKCSSIDRAFVTDGLLPFAYYILVSMVYQTNFLVDFQNKPNELLGKSYKSK